MSGLRDIARRAFALCAGPIAFSLLLSAASASSARTPNIVLLLADDLGFSDLAPYGSEIATPTLGQLAAVGLMFTNYHTAASCAPTRAMLLTGVDSHRNGVPNIPEAIPPVQSAHDNYRGTLNHDVVTVATRLADAGYHTYMAGKWHLGHTPELLPSRRGFERTFVLGDTGSDNWEYKSYLPIYDRPHWFEDGEPLDALPDDFYSSEFYVDKTIEYIESNRDDGRPFFAYVAFQAVHIPVQAPREYTEKYLGVYDEGWTRLREDRLANAVALGLVPPDTKLAPVHTTGDWEALSEDERRHGSKKMAVYAGMIDAMDHHIGRLVEYLKRTGQYDDTLFVFTSDNGSEASDPINVPGGSLFEYWLNANDYDTDYETLGERGSFVTIGPSFASAAASPLAYYKFFAHEGGTRVPLILAGGAVERGAISPAFAYVTDIAPTLLEAAGVPPTAGRHRDRAVEPMIGTSLLPLASGRVDRAHGSDESIGYELAGNAALYRGNYKIVHDRPPVGDGEWHLYDIATDPGEARDLAEAMPERLSSMLAEYRKYEADNHVLPVPDGYDQRAEVSRYGLRNRLGPWYRWILTAPIVLLVLGVATWWWRRRRRSVGRA